MKQILFVSVLCLVMTGCATQPMDRIAHLLLTDEEVSADTPWWEGLSWREFTAIMGKPDSIGEDEENLYGYVRGCTKYLFGEIDGVAVFAGSERVPRFSKPHFTPESHTLSNPFHDFAASNVACIVFGRSTPYFVVHEQTNIVSLYQLAARLRPSASSHAGCFCGMLTTVDFRTSWGSSLAHLNVYVDGSQVGVGEPQEYWDKIWKGESTALGTACLTMMKHRTPKILRDILRPYISTNSHHAVPSDFRTWIEETSNQKVDPIN